MALPRFLTRTTGSFFSQLFGYAIGGAVTSVLNPALNPLVIEAWRLDPTMLLSPPDLAEAVVQGHLTEDAAANEALGWGVSRERFGLMVAIAGSPPGVEQILDLWDRGVMTEAEVTQALRETRLKPKYVDKVKGLQRTLLSAEQLAAMEVQGVITHDQGVAGARRVSIEPEDYDRLVRVNGLPPGVQTGLTLLNRGLLTEDQFRTLVRQGHTKTEYVDALLALRREILTPSEAAAMVVQSIIAPAEGARIAAAAGISATDFDNMVKVRGRPPGPGEALEWLRRGILTEAEFAQVIRESNVKTKYTGSYLEALERLPTLVQIRSMFKAGTITEQRARDLLHKHGFAPDIVDAYLESTTQAKKATHHELTESQAIALYQSGLQKREPAKAALLRIGYDGADADELLDLADAQRVNAARRTALATIHRHFVAGQLDEQQVAIELDKIEVDPRVRDDLLAAWDVERQTVTRTLTEAQVARGVKLHLIGRDDGVTRLVAQGYSEQDARLLLAIQAGVKWDQPEVTA